MRVRRPKVQAGNGIINRRIQRIVSGRASGLLRELDALQVTEGGFERISGVTEIEQVSYVGSPYMPRCIRTQWGKEMTSNKHRSSESAKGANTIKDDLSEAITLRCALL